MAISRQLLAAVLTLALAQGHAVFAQTRPLEPTRDAPRVLREAAVPDSPPPAVRLTDRLGRPVILIPGPPALRRQGWPPPPPPRPAWVAGMLTGFIVGGYAGFGIAGRHCHCESGAGFLVGGVIGGALGAWIVKRVTR